MYKDVGDGRDAKITEKSEKARKEFWDKCEKIKKSAGYNEKLILDTANKAALEYNKVFGRLGVHPLLHLKGGKKRPRYLVDRDETWVIYKPALWQMGGTHETWRKNLQGVVSRGKNLKNAEDQYLSSEKAETLQEWHGLLTGLLWIPPEYAQKEMSGWGFIQRLDLETDGPVIIAKTWRAQRLLQVQMNRHVNTKAYMCLVHGRMENKTKHIKRKFAELGSEAGTQVMLQFDAVNDPFHEWTVGGKWTKRSTRVAESFLKPLAYYHRKEDNTDYTLVYVNILTGITHQIRITCQSEGHPLVSDDRYLPKDQAMSDLRWCPRNFLVEVRADFFDLTGPHEDERRRRYTRVSIENPLPKIFQNVLESKLTLTEQLDDSADLFVGPQYWAIGDEELMNAFPKDAEYRRKVTRWGTRRGIHLDALDRLLLLSKDDIDEVLNNYKGPSELGAEKYSTWVCPKCMHWNMTGESERWVADPDICGGGSKKGALGQACTGERQVDPDFVPPKGWLNYANDPTIHLLYTANGKWLDARRAILAKSRPSWERAPLEAEGAQATPEILTLLAAALEQKARAGEVGIHEPDLVKYPGLEGLKLPLGGVPHESLVQRMRLPGRGTGSQWSYALKAAKRIEWTADFDKRTERLVGPLTVKTDKLPEKQVKKKSTAEKERSKEEAKKRPSSPPPGEPAVVLLEDLGAASRGWGAGANDDGLKEPPPKKGKPTRQWERRESQSNPGAFYYVDLATGETSVERPADFAPDSSQVQANASREAPKEAVVWERMLSKTSGKFYFYNHKTGESRVERPPGVEVRGLNGSSPPKNDEEEVRWERRESASKPGHFYYFNSKTGENEVHPPEVDLPWTLVESKTKKGQFFYFNEATAATVVDPPSCARSARAPPAKAPPTAAKRPTAASTAKPGPAATEKLPANWTKKESDKFKGKVYYTNTKTGETSWTKPSPWERVESSSHPGKFYYQHVETGEASWEKQVVGVVDK